MTVAAAMVVSVMQMHPLPSSVRACTCACVRACVHVRACVRVRAGVHVCVSECVCVVARRVTDRMMTLQRNCVIVNLP